MSNLKRCLGLKSDASDIGDCNSKIDPIFISNRVLISKSHSLDPEFVNILQEKLNTGMEYVDFKEESETIMQQINRWASESTKGFAPKIFNKPPEHLVFIYISSIYFETKWKFIFKRTYPGRFYLNHIQSIIVPFMNVVAFFEYFSLTSSFGDLHVVEIPYRGGHKRMVVLLPPKSITANELIANQRLFLNLTELVMDKRFSKTRRISLHIPRSTFRQNWSLERDSLRMCTLKVFDACSSDFNLKPQRILPVVEKSPIITELEAATESLVPSKFKI